MNLKSYDGRDLNGFVYVMDAGEAEATPSGRYMGVIVKGATAAGLKEEWIEKLRAIETYSPPGFIRRLREGRGRLEDHPEVTAEELAAHRGPDDAWLSVLGFVVRPRKVMFGVHKGRDITVRQLMHLKQISLDKNDDG